MALIRRGMEGDLVNFLVLAWLSVAINMPKNSSTDDKLLMAAPNVFDRLLTSYDQAGQ